MTLVAVALGLFAAFMTLVNAWMERRFKARNPYDPKKVSNEAYAELVAKRRWR